MNEDDIRYALNKQVPSVTALVTNYGELPLDEELRDAVAEAVAQVLEKRLAGQAADGTQTS